MILIVAAGMVVVMGVVVMGVVAVVVAAGVGVGRDADPRSDGAGLGPLLVSPLVVVGVLALVAVVGVVGLGGLRRSSSGGPEPVPSSEDAGHRRNDREPEPLSGPPATFDAVVDVRRFGGGEGAQGEIRPVPVVDRREAGDVVEVRGQDFEAGASGVIGQCRSMATTRCRNVAPVVADDAGRVRAAYRLEGRASGEVLLVEIADQRAVASIVFGAPAPPRPVVRLDDSRILSIDGGPSRSSVVIARCASDARALDDGCHQRQKVLLDDTGRARVSLERQKDESLVVVADAASHSVIAEPLFVPGIRRSQVRLEPGRALAGVAVALFLLGLAAFIIRTTDWRPPSEASTPYLDAATSDA